MSAVAHWDAPAPVARRARRHLSLVPTAPQSRVELGSSDFQLTVRGRRMLAVFVLAVVLVGGWGIGKAFAGSSASTDVVVLPGQTLSQIAHDAYPHLPVGEAVVRVQLANDLNSQQVHAGQHLVIAG